MDPRRYPQPFVEDDRRTGVYPTDFLLEQVLDAGFDWFRKTSDAPTRVFENLLRPELHKRYGQAKIDEIAAYVRATQIRVLQSFPIEDQQAPSISINMNSSGEAPELGGLDRFAERLLDFDSLGNVVGGQEIGYHPITDSLLVGIHSVGSADKVKYIYYIVVYILMSLRSQLEETGMFNMTFQATDLSRLNEFLPANMFSRFLTVNFTSMAMFKKADVPVVTGFTLNVHT